MNILEAEKAGVRYRAKIKSQWSARACGIVLYNMNRERPMAEEQEKKEGFLRRLGKATREFIYGMAAYESVRLALETRQRLESVLLLITMGDLLGVPILRSYYSLRILPYMVPKIEGWKRRLLREKDITDGLSQG